MAITYDKDGAYIEITEDGVVYRRHISFIDCVISAADTGTEKIDKLYINDSDQLVAVLEDESEILIGAGDLTAHAALATGVHGAGASTLATTANIATHAGLADPHTGYILESLLDAQSIIAAISADTPIVVAIAEQRIVGRITGGNITGLTAAQIRTLLGIEAGAAADLTGAEIVALLEALAASSRLSHTKLDDVGVDDHHNQSHTLASHSTKAHSELSDAPENAHHTKFTTTEHTTIGDGAPHHVRYADSEAVTAMGDKADDNALHHDKYTDAAAKAAAVLAGAITDAETKAPTHDAVYDVKATADGAIAKSLLTTQDDIIVRGADNPDRLNIVEQRLVGRITSGHVTGLTAAQVLTLIGVESGATADLTGLEIVTLLEALDAGNRLDHGAGLTGLTGDDHTQYILHSLAAAEDDFLIASGANTFAKQTLAQTLTTLGKAAASGLASLNSSAKVVEQPASITDHLDDTEHGTDALTTKAPTSNRLYDHDVATTGVHGVGSNTIGSTEQALAFALSS